MVFGDGSGLTASNFGSSSRPKILSYHINHILSIFHKSLVTPHGPLKRPIPLKLRLLLGPPLKLSWFAATSKDLPQPVAE